MPSNIGNNHPDGKFKPDPETFYHPSLKLIETLMNVHMDMDIECINILLENTNLTFLVKNANDALDVAEIDSCLSDQIQYLFRFVLSNGTDSLRTEDIAKEDIKLLRWLLKSYGIAAACEYNHGFRCSQNTSHLLLFLGLLY